MLKDGLFTLVFTLSILTTQATFAILSKVSCRVSEGTQTREEFHIFCDDYILKDARRSQCITVSNSGVKTSAFIKFVGCSKIKIGFFDPVGGIPPTVFSRHEFQSSEGFKFEIPFTATVQTAKTFLVCDPQTFAL